MLKIVNASKSKAKNAQHAQFVTDILAAIPKAIAEQYGFHLQYSAFALAGNNELLCFQARSGLFRHAGRSGSR